MKSIITATVQNQSGVLNRVAGLLAKRQFNIESLSVGKTETEGISNITFVVEVEDDHKLEQLTKQLDKQIHVLKVSDITDRSYVARELALVKVACNAQTRNEIDALIKPFRAVILDVSPDNVTVEVTGGSQKIEALIDLFRPYGIKEITRTGLTAFLRGNQPQVTDIQSYSLLNNV